MITAQKLKYLTTLPHQLLEGALPKKSSPRLTSAQFIGITNGGQFCYSAVDAEEQVIKVFVSYDPAADRVSVDC
jgi:hypothetical protein